MTALLEVRDLTVTFPRHGVTAVEGLSFVIEPGEMVAIVGGSGSGKSAAALAVMGLSDAGAVIGAGSRVRFEGVELTTLDPAAWRSLRGRRLAMVFQDPQGSLNPAMSVGAQVTEAILVHERGSVAEARTRATVMLARVGIDASLIGAYPHELSGGQCQRVMIAMALVLRPALVIADEPTSALDVLTQSQLLELLRTLQRETGTALLLITHDLGVVATTCSRVLVLHEGRCVEEATTERLFTAPQHPVTVELLRALPRLTVGA